MKAICIDGKPTTASFSLPEGIPLKVRQSPVFPDSYLVDGYEIDHLQHSREHWHKRRFIPLSTIDETELLEQRQQELQTA